MTNRIHSQLQHAQKSPKRIPRGAIPRLDSHPGRQSGVVLLLLFFVLFTAGASIMLSALSNNAVSARRNEATREAMSEVKEAIIGFAVLYGENYGPGGAGPGHLFCPDISNDGQENSPCGANALGRLPQSITPTIGPTVYLGDYNAGSDQQFWFAVADEFRGSIAGIANAASVGSLTVDGQNGIAAILFAPGEIVGAQVRPDLAVAQYLEDSNTAGPDYVTFAAGDFNDSLLTITVDELMAPVTARIAETIRTEIDNFHVVNGNYPVDQAQFATALVTEPAWFDANNWNTNTVYTQIDGDNASLLFTGCNITYTVSFAVTQITKSSSVC